MRCIGTPLEPSPPPARMDFSSATTAMLFFCREGDSSLEDSEEWWLVATAVCLRRSRQCKSAVLAGPTKSSPQEGAYILRTLLLLRPLPPLSLLSSSSAHLKSAWALRKWV